MYQEIKKNFPEIFQILKKEIRRQQETINLIPSENYVSEAVLEAAASVFTNKYVEGYPQKRYYPGCEFADEIENLCIDLAKKVFDLDNNWEVHVQPLSGSVANLAIYSGLLNPGEKILSMKLTHGGHLSHGYKAHLSSRIWEVVHYGVDSNGYIDYEEIRKIAQKERPKLIISGATAYPRIIDFERFYHIAKEIGAYHLADISHIAGLIAAKLHPSPFRWADVVMSTTHKTLRGPRSAIIFVKKEIYQQIRKSVFPGLQGGSHQHIVFAKAVAFAEALRPEFLEYQREIVKNAKVLEKELKKYGLNLLTGGTDNHLLLINLKEVIDASLAENLLERANILANRNSIPEDKSPFRPSGLRLGTPAITTRGMKEAETEQIAKWIYEILIKRKNPEAIKPQVVELCKNFPLYEDLL